MLRAGINGDFLGAIVDALHKMRFLREEGRP